MAGPHMALSKLQSVLIVSHEDEAIRATAGSAMAAHGGGRSSDHRVASHEIDVTNTRGALRQNLGVRYPGFPVMLRFVAKC